MNAIYDAAIIGSGPAGLSAALLLGRSRRSVIVCDHGKPRNYAAEAVHGFLGLDGVAPAELRKRGVKECEKYGVKFFDSRVLTGCRDEVNNRSVFRLELQSGSVVRARKLLLATGVRDELPEIPGFHAIYGISAHHCPYCDGWEHADKRLVAFGKGDAAAKLSITLLAWSTKVWCCTDGVELSGALVKRLRKYDVGYRSEKIMELSGRDGKLQKVHFSDGDPIPADAFFFSAGQVQRSTLPQDFGCKCDGEGLVESSGKQCSNVRGLFLAGDADGDVQFAIVAAAEGAIAATAIVSELEEEDYP